MSATTNNAEATSINLNSLSQTEKEEVLLDLFSGSEK